MLLYFCTDSTLCGVPYFSFSILFLIHFKQPAAGAREEKNDTLAEKNPRPVHK